MNNLETKINAKTATLAVIGLGYVGLPLAVEMAKAGFTVLGIDLIADKVDRVNRGDNYIGDVKDEDLKRVVASGKLKAYADFSSVALADCVSICVPTPLNRANDPDMSFIENATASIVEYAHADMLVVLESTTYPGTTREYILPEFERKGFEVGKNFFLCFSPERVDPGNPKFNTKNTPKIVGGVTPECIHLATLLYESVVDKVIPVSSPEAAELSKLLENTFRNINIGLVNEMGIICDKLGVDVWEVIDAAATKPFGYMKFLPGPGLGGHCIPIDPLYLTWKMRNYNFVTRFINVADDVNRHMPNVVVDKLAQVMNLHKMCINGSKVVILGMAYKENIDDLRESPALEIYSLLKHAGADVVYNDDFAPCFYQHEDKSKPVYSVPLTAELLKSADCVLITTAHKNYNPKFIVENSKLILDTRNLTKGYEKSHVYKLGSGKTY